ncbi:insulin-like growth factor-binding protein 3 receptor isoform X1 [Oryctolagus cuniculus]|uniref:insulin-like growth factor-binding protein 3 receptor isoform X1 n=1 Tax=Oryctolagus cuniculus TaxID=9986 RepID=UPI0038797CC1
MGSCQAGHNLHLCLVHHPPLVCATLILLLLGLSGLGLGGFLLTHRSGLRSPDIPEDWVSFLRSFGQLTLCPVDGTVTATRQGAHVVGLVTTLNFGDGADRNKTQTFQASIPGRQLGLKAETRMWTTARDPHPDNIIEAKRLAVHGASAAAKSETAAPPLMFPVSSPMPLTGSSAEEPILVTARVTPERTPGACLYFNAAPGILPSSQPPISCLEDGTGNATLSPRMGEECVRIWSHEGLVLTKLLTSEELALCGSRLLILGSFLLLFCGLLCCVTAVCFHPRRESHWSRTRL